MAAAVAMFSFFRGLGQTMGIAIGGTIFQKYVALSPFQFSNFHGWLTYYSALTAKLLAQPLFAAHAKELAKDATALVDYMKNAPDGEARTVMRTAYTESLRTVYIVIAGVAFVAMVASAFIKHYGMDKPLETDQGMAMEEVKREEPGP